MEENKKKVQRNGVCQCQMHTSYCFFSSWGDFCDTSYVKRVFECHAVFIVYIFFFPPLSISIEAKWLDLASWH